MNSLIIKMPSNIYFSFIVFKQLIIFHNVIKLKEFVITPCKTCQFFGCFPYHFYSKLVDWSKCKQNFVTWKYAPEHILFYRRTKKIKRHII